MGTDTGAKHDLAAKAAAEAEGAQGSALQVRAHPDGNKAHLRAEGRPESHESREQGEDSAASSANDDPAAGHKGQL